MDAADVSEGRAHEVEILSLGGSEILRKCRHEVATSISGTGGNNDGNKDIEEFSHSYSTSNTSV